LPSSDYTANRLNAKNKKIDKKNIISYVFIWEAVRE